MVKPMCCEENEASNQPQKLWDAESVFIFLVFKAPNGLPLFFLFITDITMLKYTL